ncbi:hypothetical protein EDD18DRAFT_1367185 [Armillaria luteobubalina]|uniref:Uncharacterized protein n=1 Tax=Armillaria luteobubalina TaxID=153913 RepID=A0AA39P1A0_9AGAR|nr:hypothetical protein EDD18DRAFT_1367185 [Armillaria luteobubalina]
MSNNPNSSEPPPMGCLLYYEWQGQRYLIDYEVFNFTLVQGQYLDEQVGKHPDEDIVSSFFDYFNEEEQAAQGDTIVMQVCKWKRNNQTHTNKDLAAIDYNNANNAYHLDPQAYALVMARDMEDATMAPRKHAYMYKLPPCVFVTIAGPSYLGTQQPDCDTGLQLVGAHPKPGLLLQS